MSIDQDFIKHLEERATLLRELHEGNGAIPENLDFVSVEEFTLKYGKFFGCNQPLPAFVERGEMKQCFTNSSEQFLQLMGEVAYVEGIAMGKKLGFPIHHAWLVNESGEVFDPTWTYEPGEALYYGVPFSDDYFFETIQREEYYGIITPGGMFNQRLMNRMDDPETFIHPWFLKDIIK